MLASMTYCDTRTILTRFTDVSHECGLALAMMVGQTLTIVNTDLIHHSCEGSPTFWRLLPCYAHSSSRQHYQQWRFYVGAGGAIAPPNIRVAPQIFRCLNSLHGMMGPWMQFLREISILNHRYQSYG